MPARLVSDNGEHVVIRPLAYVGEDEARLYAKEVGAADHRLLLSGVRRPQPAAPARQAADHGPRGRAPGRQAVDAQGAGQRHAAAPARHCASIRAASCATASPLRLRRSAAGRSSRSSTDASVRRCERSSSASASARVRVGDRVDRRDRPRPARAARRRPRRHRRRRRATSPRKIRELRVFEGDDGKPMDRSVVDVGGGVLVVSQFTLYGDVRKGRRPSFDAAAPPERRARALRGLRERIARRAHCPSRPANSRR